MFLCALLGVWAAVEAEENAKAGAKRPFQQHHGLRRRKIGVGVGNRSRK